MPTREPAYEPQTETRYECLDCGTEVVHATSTYCTDCGSVLRNLATPME